MKLKGSHHYNSLKKKFNLLLNQENKITFSEIIEIMISKEEKKCKNVRISFSLNNKKIKNILKITCSLPNSIIVNNIKKKIVVLKEGLKEEEINFLKNEKMIELMEFSELSKIINEKKWNFSKIISHTDNEKKIKILEKFLGQKNIYPNKKNKFLTENVLEKVKKIKEGEREIKSDKDGNINCLIGKTSFSKEQLEENYIFLYKKIISLRPNGQKGIFLKKKTISTNNEPGLKF